MNDGEIREFIGDYLESWASTDAALLYNLEYELTKWSDDEYWRHIVPSERGPIVGYADISQARGYVAESQT